MVPASSSISQPHLGVWHHGGSGIEKSWMRGTYREAGGDRLCDSFAARGMWSKVAGSCHFAVSVSVCPLGHDLSYSKVDASSRADNLCSQRSCFPPLTSPFSQVSASIAHPLLQTDQISLLSLRLMQSPKVQENKRPNMPWYDLKVLPVQSKIDSEYIMLMPKWAS